MQVKLSAGSFITLSLLLLFSGLAPALFAGGSSEPVPAVVLVNDQGYNETTLDNVRLRWKVEGGNLSCIINAPTTGWVSIGFDPEFRMKGADYIIGYVKDNQVVLQDEFGNGDTSHKADTELGGTDNILAKGGREENGATELSFTIPLASGDAYDKALEQGKEYKVLVAYGGNDKDDMNSYHAYRGSLLITL